jgi:dihydroorotate dehydrogenase (fumarate)
LSKSATLHAQTGNPQPRIFHVAQASFNSEGLPNNGIDYYIAAEIIQEIVGETPHKPYIVSLSGKTLADNLVMLQKIATANQQHPNNLIAAIELNLACPNIIGKPIIAYDVPQMRDILQQVHQLVVHQHSNHPNLPPLGIKLAPYLYFVQLSNVATLINEYKDMIKYIVTINTLGNALCIDMTSQQPCIAANNGFAGMSGPAVHYTALANVRQFRTLLDPCIDIVGVGGVTTGEQAAAMLVAGACAVQLGTVHWKEGPACFDRIAHELRTYMSQHGFTNISELQQSWSLWIKQGAERSRAMKQQQH